jgi:hypothetical protein
MRNKANRLEELFVRLTATRGPHERMNRTPEPGRAGTIVWSAK